MVRFRAEVGEFEHCVLHDLPLQTQVVAYLAGLLNRGRQRIELRRWSSAVGQVCIYGEHWVRQVAECSGEGRGIRRIRHESKRKDVVVEYTESRSHDRFSAFVSLPCKANPRLDVLFRYGDEMVFQNRCRRIMYVQQIGHFSIYFGGISDEFPP